MVTRLRDLFALGELLLVVAVAVLMAFGSYLLWWGWEFVSSMSGDRGRVKQWP
jgi:hypothetical protein